MESTLPVPLLSHGDWSHSGRSVNPGPSRFVRSRERMMPSNLNTN